MSKLLQTQQLFSFHVMQLLKYIYDKNYTCTLADAYRCPEMAALYYAQGKGINDSQHCKRLAIDLNIFNANNNLLTEKADYEIFGKYWENLDQHCRWGGRFTKLVDCGHFEMQEPK